MQLFLQSVPYFEEEIWRQHTKKRPKYLNFILQDVWIIDKAKEDILRLFGQEGNSPDSNRWTYFVGKKLWWQDEYLAIYFENNRVDRVTLEKFK